MFNSIKELLTKPLGFTEILIIFLIIAFLLMLLIAIDIYYQRIKAKKFINKYPKAALVYIIC